MATPSVPSAPSAPPVGLPAASPDQGDDERAASLWPPSTRSGELHSSSFANTRFDPVAEERGRLQAQAAASFDVCHPALALRAVMLVQGLLAIVALGMASGWTDWLARQAVLSFCGLAATLLWLVGVCAGKTSLQRLNAVPRGIAVTAFGAVVAAAVWTPLLWAGLGGDVAVHRVLAIGLAGAAAAALLWAWLDLRARIWHPANASARLAELQARIRPHFLFNALNTALALVRVDPAQAEVVLEALAQLFRTALADAGASVALEEEVELARRYLEIEQIRFGPRLRVHWHLASADLRVTQARVPPLVLQPLVENAVRHGVEPVADGGTVHIRALYQRGQVCIEVVNTVGAEASSAGHGMALHNIRERLRLLHDVAAQCDVWREEATLQTPARFHARLLLPSG